jgi:large subunit ribosomal protein L18
VRTKIRDPRRAQREARQGRVRRRLRTSQRPRLTVFRSAKHIYAQLEDAVTGRTLGGASTRSPALRGELAKTGNVAAAKRVGQAIAEVARAKGIGRVVFNRNGFLYHGRVKALAEAAREAGLEF